MWNATVMGNPAQLPHVGKAKVRLEADGNISWIFGMSEQSTDAS